MIHILLLEVEIKETKPPKWKIWRLPQNPAEVQNLWKRCDFLPKCFPSQLVPSYSCASIVF